MKTRILFFAVLLCAAAQAADVTPQDRYKPVAAAIGELIRREIAEKSMPALSIAVVDGDNVVWAQGYGYADPERKLAANADTVYRIGSVSMLFTGIGIMQLVENGELDLDAPITRYLPEFQPKNPFGKPITLRQLMSHRAGLVREPPVGHSFDNTNPTLADTVRSLNGTELVYAPESHTKYSNAGIATAGYVLEKLKHQAFAPYLKSKILAPLGMRHSAFEPLPEVTSLAKAYMWTVWGRVFEAPTFQLAMAPCGSMDSTVNDLSRFVMALFAGGKGILKPETLEAMWKPQYSSPFGIGFHVSNFGGRRLVGHGGTIYGFATQLAALPDEKLGVIAVTTTDGANLAVNSLVEQTLEAMLAVRKGKPLPKLRFLPPLSGPPKRTWTTTPPPPLPERWKGLVGEYGWDYDVLYVHERNGKLTALVEWFDLDPLTEVSPDTFRFPTGALYDGETVTFRRDAKGRAAEASVGGVVFKRLPDPAEVGGVFRIRPLKPVAELRRAALAGSPPEETGNFRRRDLVDVTTFDPTIRLDIRYATTNNFLSTPVYTLAKAFLERPAAEALARASKALGKYGFGVLIHDAYRPWFVTKIFWEATPPDKRAFVANPAEGSRHNRGCAVDMTLYDLKTGKPAEMTGVYDEMSDRSYPDYPGGADLERWRRELLRRTMEAQNFTVFEAEWWHFDYNDWRKYAIQNAPFEQLLSGH